MTDQADLHGPGPIPPPDAPDAPWFVYESGPGWVQGRPYSRQGRIAILVLLIGPIIGVAALFAILWPPAPLVMAGVVVVAVTGSLASIFVLMFKLGRRIS